MMKYTITMSCGHEDTVELFGSNKERERKLEYLKSSGICKECYKKKMQEDAKKDGFLFNASVLPYIDDTDGSILLSVWFSGYTKPYKDEIKSLGGYRWKERESANDFYSTSDAPMCWNKTIKMDELKEEIIKAVSIGADNTVTDKGLFSMIHCQIALEQQRKWNEKKNEIDSINKPVIPDIINGRKWNQKIYGRPGNFSIYLDGEKEIITDEQAEEINDYLKESEEYKKKVENIKNA